MRRLTFVGVSDKLENLGMTIRRITLANPWGAYLSGVLITEPDGSEIRYAGLQEVQFHVIENRNSPNFVWKD